MKTVNKLQNYTHINIVYIVYIEMIGPNRMEFEMFPADRPRHSLTAEQIRHVNTLNSYCRAETVGLCLCGLGVGVSPV